MEALTSTRIYALNATLLVMHEIDSAYWKEWDLFGLPGGPAGFLVVHFPLLLAVLWGHAQVVLGRPAGTWMSLALAAAGGFALVVHGALLLAGRPEFRSVASMALLTAVGLASALQAHLSLSALRARRARAGGPRPGA